jgi:hypothetical protein
MQPLKGGFTMKQLTPLMFGLMLAFGVSTTAMAQGAPAQDGTGAEATAAMPQPQEANFSEQDIQKFADVQPAIESIRVEYSERLQEVSDPQEAAALQNEAVEKMVETVNEEGLEVETYNSIAIALQNDASLRERVEAAMN